MLAAVVTTPPNVQLTDLPAPNLPAGGALIRVTGCGLCGSDLDKLLNRPDTAGKVLGHEVVGVIDTLSPEAAKLFPHLTPGTRVVAAHHVPCQHCHYCQNGAFSMCRHFKETNITPGGFAQQIAVTEDHLRHTVFVIPTGLPDTEASCMEPLACCVRSIGKLPQVSQTTCLVIGLGFIGLMSTQVLQNQGAQVFGFDLKPERVALGNQEDLLHQAFDQPEALRQAILEATEGRGVDTVMLTVVNPKALEMALGCVRDGGSLLLFTSYGPGTPILNQNDLYFREITVYSSYSPGLQDLKDAFEMIQTSEVRVAPLVSHTMPLEDLQEAVNLYQSTQAMKVFVTL